MPRPLASLSSPASARSSRSRRRSYDRSQVTHRDRALRRRRLPPRPPGDVPRPADERRARRCDWGICGVGVLPCDRAMQRGAWTRRTASTRWCVKHPDGTLRAAGDRLDRRVPVRAGRPGGGDREDGRPGDPDRLADRHRGRLQLPRGHRRVRRRATRPSRPTSQPGAAPTTAFGLVTEALVRRRERGVAAVHGDVLRQHPGQRRRRAAKRSPRSPGCGTRSWATGSSSEVRVPELDGRPDHAGHHRRGPGRDRASGSASRTRWPVVCEPFTQWVLEDTLRRRAARRSRTPGVQLVDDVEPYELMKLRLLNASHQALCYFGYLAGYRLVHEVAPGPAVRRASCSPTWTARRRRRCTPVPGIDLDAYKRDADRAVLQRRRCATPSPGCARRAPTASRSGCCRSSGRTSPPAARSTLSAAVVASWARYAEGVDEQGEPIEVVDRLADTLTATAAAQREDPLAFIAQPRAVRRPGRRRALRRRRTATRWRRCTTQGARATLESLG